MSQSTEDHAVVAKYLDAALLAALAPENTKLLELAERLRTAGLTLLVLGSACIASIGLLGLASSQGDLATLTLQLAALASLLVGAWLIDKASKAELHAYPSTQGLFERAKGLPSRSEMRRKRHTGACLQMLACLCVCAAVVPLPDRNMWFAAAWAGCSALSLLVSWRYLSTASAQEKEAHEASAAAARRIQDPKHRLRPIQ